jgi:hypothetical protein
VSEDVEADLAADERFERSLFWRELLIVAIVAVVIAARVVLG